MHVNVGDFVHINLEIAGLDNDELSRHYVIGHIDGEPFTVSHVDDYDDCFCTQEIRGFIGQTGALGVDYHWLLPIDAITEVVVDEMPESDTSIESFITF